MNDLVTCLYCGNSVDPHNKWNWHRVIGWERKGQAGGSDITLREPQDEWACNACIHMIKSGVSPSQESLI